MGGWPLLPRDLPVVEFMGKVAEIADRHSEVWTLVAQTHKGKIPVGTIAGAMNGNMIWTRVVWFPWASLRNKIECALKFAKQVGDEAVALYAAREDEKDFLVHLAKYAVVKRVGTVIRGGESSALFQSRNFE
jgi:hypothetical protein